jgi:predicted NAD/FAD-dependent oxidoreductase
MTNLRVAIIGAGVSGLMAARHLKEAGAQVTLFDKSRGIGGRLSTRYADAYEFDHGAQYFTVSDERFRSVVEEAQKTGAVAPWPGRALYLKTGLLTADTGRERWVGTPRMNSFAKYLAESAQLNPNILLGQRVKHLTRENDGLWTLSFESNDTGPVQDRSGFNAVICTAPSPQASLLLPHNFAARSKLDGAQMDACFALMIGLKDPIDLGWDTLRVNDLPVSWLAVNSAKPGRASDNVTLMVHASPEWSNANVNTDRAEILEVMMSITAALTRLNLKDPEYVTLHRWLYASVSKSPETPCLVDEDKSLVAAGDWCLGGRVEGAALSGLAAAEAVLTF